MTSLLLACVVGAAGCETEPSSSDVERHPDSFRCRFTRSDGTCRSTPIACALPDGHSTTPRCPDPGEIIPLAEDSCADRTVCSMDGAAGYRCRYANSDGTCTSLPASCPVTLPHSDTPHCPLHAELIPVADDHCAHQLICAD